MDFVRIITYPLGQRQTGYRGPPKPAVKVEKTFDVEMVNFSDAVVHAGGAGLEFVETVGQAFLQENF